MTNRAAKKPRTTDKFHYPKDGSPPEWEPVAQLPLDERPEDIIQSCDPLAKVPLRPLQFGVYKNKRGELISEEFRTRRQKRTLIRLWYDWLRLDHEYAHLHFKAYIRDAEAALRAMHTMTSAGFADTYEQDFAMAKQIAEDTIRVATTMQLEQHAHMAHAANMFALYAVAMQSRVFCNLGDVLAYASHHAEVRMQTFNARESERMAEIRAQTEAEVNSRNVAFMTIDMMEEAMAAGEIMDIDALNAVLMVQAPVML